MILRWVILTAASRRALPLKTFLMTGYVLSADWVRMYWRSGNKAVLNISTPAFNSRFQIAETGCFNYIV